MSENNITMMIVALIAGIPGITASLLAILNRKKLDAIQVELNGRLTELLRVSVSQARAEGRLEGPHRPGIQPPHG